LVPSLAALAVTMAWPAEATADPLITTMCYDSHESGQLKRKRGEWRKARTSFAACGDSRCPSIVQRDCVTWAGELAAQQPSIVVAVVRDDGKDLLNARVTLDGTPISIDGRAVEVDPGEHRVRVVLPSRAPFEQRFAVREGERLRRVNVTVPKPGAESSSKPTAVTWISGGVAVLALGSFVTFAALGKSRENELADDCAGKCSDAEVGEVRRSYLLADVSLGVAVVAGGIAVASWLMSPKSGKDSRPIGAERMRFRIAF